jgi:hypothetical protein
MSERNKKILSILDYDRSIKKSYEKKKLCGSAVPQLGAQEKQSIPPLKVLLDLEHGIIELCQDMGLTPAPIYEDRIPTSSGDAWKYELGKPLARPELVKKLPTQMYRLHQLYMEESKLGRTMIDLKVRDDDYFHGEDFQLYNQDSLDIPFISC